MLPVNHLPGYGFAQDCRFRHKKFSGPESNIKCSANASPEVIDMTVRSAAARSEALAPGADEKCLGCKVGHGKKRFCEVFRIEISKQCCICRGGHECYWWELCEAIRG